MQYHCLPSCLLGLMLKVLSHVHLILTVSLSSRRQFYILSCTMIEWQKTDDEMKDSHSVWNGRGLSTLSVNPIKWSNTFKKLVSNSRRIGWVCLTILWVDSLSVNIIIMCIVNVHSVSYQWELQATVNVSIRRRFYFFFDVKDPVRTTPIWYRTFLGLVHNV